MLEIHELSKNEFDVWDAFVDAHPEGTFFHLSAWADLISKSFGHRTHYLYAISNNEIQGVLPLVHVNSQLFGNTLVSTPFCVRGGAIALNSDIESMMIERAVDLAEELGVDQIELRDGVEKPLDEEWQTPDLYYNFSKSITNDHDENMKAIPRKQRAMVRKGIGNELRAEVSSNIDPFFQIYAESVRDLGTPVFSRRYFANLIDAFSGNCDITTIYKDDAPCASVMSFFYKDTVMPYYGGGLRLARAVKGYDFMYWSLMCRSAETGYTIFDYGRSKVNTGAYSFKKNWGFEPTPLPYAYRLVKASKLAEKNPNNPKYRRFIETWKKLPLPVANAVGPYISKNLG